MSSDMNGSPPNLFGYQSKRFYWTIFVRSGVGFHTRELTA